MQTFLNRNVGVLSIPMFRVLIILTLVTVSACEQKNPEEKIAEREKWKTLRQPGYYIEYPPNWELDQSKNLGSSFLIFGRSGAEGKFRENVNLLIQDLTGLNMDLNTYVGVSEQQIKTMVINSKILESKRMKTEVDEYHEIIYLGDHGSFKLKWKQFYRIIGDKAYVLTFTGTQETYNDYISIADKILDSFRLTEN